MLSIIFILTLILINVLFLLIKKADEKINILYEIVKLGIINLCYNLFIVYVLSTLNILSTLVSLSIINIIIAIVMGVYLYKTKSIQKYYIKLADIIISALLVIMVLMICFKQFGYSLDIKYYVSADSAIHYVAADEFYEKSILLQKAPQDTIYDFKDMMPGAYVNIGILFKVVSSFISHDLFYKVFITFDIFMLILAALMFYFTINQYAKGKGLIIISCIMAILYFTGYPLNSTSTGFVYLGMGVIIINLIINIFSDFVHKKMHTGIFIIVLALANFSLFFTYYLFMPVVYLAELIFLTYYLFKTNSKEYIKNGLILCITLFLPAICGIIYFILPAYFIDIGTAKQIDGLALDGFIYKDLYWNFVLILPFILYFIRYMQKHRKINLEVIILILLTFFMIYLFYLGTKGIVSAYYFYKNYYFLWLIGNVAMFIGLSKLYKEKKDITIILVSILLLITIINISLMDELIEDGNQGLIRSSQSRSQMKGDIHRQNIMQIFSQGKTYDENGLELLDFARKSNKDIYILGDFRQILWGYSMLRTVDRDISVGICYTIVEAEHISDFDKNYLEALSILNDHYIICMKSVQQFKDTFEEYDIIFENDSGFVLYKR